MKDEYGLTLKQRRFADNYIETGNATQSYINAGYETKKGRGAEVEASKILRKPNVQAYIKSITDRINAQKIASQEEVLQYLSSAMRGEITEEVVGFSIEGLELSAKKEITPKDRNKAAELLGKRYLLFTEQAKIDMTNKIIFTENIPASDDDDDDE